MHFHGACLSGIKLIIHCSPKETLVSTHLGSRPRPVYISWTYEFAMQLRHVRVVKLLIALPWQPFGRLACNTAACRAFLPVTKSSRGRSFVRMATESRYGLMQYHLEKHELAHPSPY